MHLHLSIFAIAVLLLTLTCSVQLLTLTCSVQRLSEWLKHM